MAATRLIALHVNKGKTVAQCLADRTDYSQNASKTNDGEFISSYECDPKTADEEFLLSKRQYQHITGRQQKNNIIAYQIRQSFKPGEITPELANKIGYASILLAIYNGIYRSGTGMTVRYAQRLKREIIIIDPITRALSKSHQAC